MTTREETGNNVRELLQVSEEGRALKYFKKRQKMVEEMTEKMEAMEAETKKRQLSQVDSRFKGSRNDALEELFNEETVGLITADEFREKRKMLIELQEVAAKKQEEEEAAKAKPKVLNRAKKIKLSFGDEADEDECRLKVAKSLEAKPKKFFGKDPLASTSFLRDAERERFLTAERNKLVKEFYAKEAVEKEETLSITYSFYDGTGHRRAIQIKRGATVGEFLEACRKQLAPDFPEVRSMSPDGLMYVKEDVILPSQLTFHELIRDRVRGKSGPLFDFDVKEDVRLVNDSRIEVTETHAGKIVDRKWYEKHKHIFPASRWEQYDSTKVYEKYTIRGHELHGDEIQKKGP
eukprot:GDKH01009832.1.p1 GENE.GDKH01009832.1~~GDKH01009832.1.p1  ORF type:complete len:349 (-),score=74.34 GDKH01009832.1:89-1135(-)